jgi:hypothetical protein
MPLAKHAALAAIAALALAACGTTAKPEAGTLRAATRVQKGVDDPRSRHIPCLQAAKVPVVKVGQVGLQLGTPPNQAKVLYLPTPGAAQQEQTDGTAAGAEVIGSALLFPEHDSAAQLTTIENCLSIGVKG